MSDQVKKVVLHSQSGYDAKHDEVLQKLIDEKVLLFCTVGKDCELWHDIMDEIFVGYGEERDFHMDTTWHEDETLEEVIEFAKSYEIENIDNEQVRVIQI